MFFFTSLTSCSRTLSYTLGYSLFFFMDDYRMTRSDLKEYSKRRPLKRIHFTHELHRIHGQSLILR